MIADFITGIVLKFILSNWAHAALAVVVQAFKLHLFHNSYIKSHKGFGMSDSIN